jgi:three-Cys-motif partner protein
MVESLVGPWAQDKLDRLGKYLNAYTTIMRKQPWCSGFVYVDALAGPGRHKVRGKEEQLDLDTLLLDVATFSREDAGQARFIDGSPRVALDIQFPFSWYVFIEKDPSRVSDLQKLKATYAETRNVVIRESDCNRYLLDKLVNNPKVDWNKWRAVVFLDPFGMQVPWSTVAALGQTRAIEVFLNFPVGMAIQRLLLRSGTFTQRQREKLDSYFGSPEWYGLLYRMEPGLFGEAPVKVGESGHTLVNWYRERLRAVFGHASKAALIRNTKGGHLYYLLLATPNKTGLKIANDILSAGETV